jgi:hypothetical protein
MVQAFTASRNLTVKCGSICFIFSHEYFSQLNEKRVSYLVLELTTLERAFPHVTTA